MFETYIVNKCVDYILENKEKLVQVDEFLAKFAEWYFLRKF